MRKSVYLDFNASVLPVPGVKEAVSEILEQGGNASSIHAVGQQARKYLTTVRQSLASIIDALPQEIYFTGSGTQANAMAILGVPVSYIIASSIEHASVLENLRLKREKSHSLLPVSSQGVVDLEALEKSLLNISGSCLISIMLANNETGVIEPIKKIVEIAKKYKALVHTDAIQAFGKMPLSFKELGVDLMTLSSHKIGGPQGVGVLIKKDTVPFEALYFGGGQEKGVQHGTENLPGIVGFGAALKKIDVNSYEKLGALRCFMEEQLKKHAPAVEIFSKDVDRLPNTSCICMPGVEKDLQLMAFDLAGFSVSSGAACSSGKIKTSFTLEALGYSQDIINTAVRVSLGWKTTKEDIEDFIKTWVNIYNRHHKVQKK